MLHGARLRHKSLLLLASWTCCSPAHTLGHQSVAAAVPTGRVSTPQALAIDPKTHKVYAVDMNRDRLLVLDEDTGAKSEIAVGHQPDAVALDPTLDRAYVVCAGSGYVSVINTSSNTVVTTVPTDRRPYAIGVDPQRHKIYVTNTFSNQLTLIDGQTNRAQALPLGSKDTVLVDSQHGAVYFTSYEATQVTRWNEATATAAQLPAVNHLWQLAVDGTGTSLFGVSIGEDALVSIAAQPNGTPHKSATAAMPDAIAFDSGRNQLLVTSYTQNTLSFADPRTLRTVATAPTGEQPVAIAVDAQRGRVYVVNLKSNDVTVVDLATRRVVQTVPAGSQPYALAIDEERGSVYVANYDGPALTRVFASQPLPSVAHH